MRVVPGGDVERRSTARLQLRRPVAGDVEWLAALHSDPANYVHAPGDVRSLDGGRAVAREMIADWDAAGIGYWVVESADGLRPASARERLGMVGIKGFAFSGRPAWNLYYRFGPTARGRGFAVEAGREAIAVAALLDPERPVLARTRPANAPARRLATALRLRRAPELDGPDGLVVYTSAPTDGVVAQP